jgi:hypothetical protein
MQMSAVPMIVGRLSTSAPIRRGHPARRGVALRVLAVLLPLAAIAAVLPAVATARAGSLSVRVTDAMTGLPIPGAFVQVGPSPGDPFPSNSGSADIFGWVTFVDPKILGPQTVTAAATGHARLTVMHAAADSIAMALHPEIAPSSLPSPKAEISGTVTGIAMQTNDGNLDIGVVYPDVRLGDLLSTRMLPFEVPSDTVNFPVVGPVVLPGNVVVPSQTEYFLLTFSKPTYHFFVPDGQTYEFLVVAGRLPLTALGGSGLPLNEFTMREIGAERGVAVNGSRTLNLASDLALAHTLTVSAAEAPIGSRVFVTAVADLQGGSRSIFFEAKSALRDTLGSIHLSGLNPAGDLADEVPYLAGYYGDSAAANLYQAGRVDRSPLTLPASRSLGQFFLLPSLHQEGDSWHWSDVMRPGITPAPTWAIATFRVEASTPGDPAVTPRTLWEAWVPAGDLSFRLPVLPVGVPGGLVDPGQTPEEDQLLWDQWIADPSGDIEEVMANAFGTLTRWSRRTIEVYSPITDVGGAGLGTLAGRGLTFRLAPNPGPELREIFWDLPPPGGEPVCWTVVSPSGRLLASGTFPSSGMVRDSSTFEGTRSLPTGVYWIRLEVGQRVGSVPLVVIR